MPRDSVPPFAQLLLALWAVLLVINGVLDLALTRGDRTGRLLAGIVLSVAVAALYSYCRPQEDR